MDLAVAVHAKWSSQPLVDSRNISGTTAGAADVQVSERSTSPSHVYVYSVAARSVSRAAHVSGPRRCPEWVLRLAPAAAVEPRTRGCAAAPADPGLVHGELLIGRAKIPIATTGAWGLEVDGGELF